MPVLKVKSEREDKCDDENANCQQKTLYIMILDCITNMITPKLYM